MKKFEYKFKPVEGDALSQKTLNTWGQEGWELCSVVDAKEGSICILKKQIIT